MTVADSQPRLAGSRSDDGVEAVTRLAADRACLRVEFFGASAAGKTTTALVLSAVLQAQGLPVRLVQCGRTAEPGVLQPPRAGLSLSVQLMKLAAGLPALLATERRYPVIRELLSILSPGNRIRELRIRRYAVDLCQAWRDNQRAGEVLILDQGFLTLLCSLALLSDPIDRSAMARAVALIPRPDLLIHIDAPRKALESRLQDRERRRRGIERLFQDEIGVRLRQAEIASVLGEILAEDGRAPLRVRSEVRADLNSAVQMIAEKIKLLMKDTPE